jgi:7,8-dihydropterin-6-yl-methyl-4-(beta-D-ribofuranosyl)aminobenzene 5'-phosphate synthase
MKKLAITILTENVAGGKFLAEHGLSYLLEIDNEQILFDTGHSDIFLKNAERLGIDIKKNVQTVVLSHGHWDHGDGLQFIKNKTLITHPASFLKRYRKADHSTVGLTLSKDEIKNRFNLIESEKHYKITENLFFLGEIPRKNNFESKTTTFELEDAKDDFIDDDSAIAAIVNNELVVITGCSHSGICNICEHAKKVTGIDKIGAVIGGFHLKRNNLQTQKTVAYFKKNAVKRVLPSHCTELPALAVFYDNFEIQQIKTGMTFEF